MHRTSNNNNNIKCFKCFHLGRQGNKASKCMTELGYNAGLFVSKAQTLIYIPWFLQQPLCILMKIPQQTVTAQPGRKQAQCPGQVTLSGPRSRKSQTWSSVDSSPIGLFTPHLSWEVAWGQVTTFVKGTAGSTQRQLLYCIPCPQSSVFLPNGQFVCKNSRSICVLWADKGLKKKKARKEIISQAVPNEIGLISLCIWWIKEKFLSSLNKPWQLPEAMAACWINRGHS